MVSRECSGTLGISSWRTSEPEEADRADVRPGGAATGGVTGPLAAEGVVAEAAAVREEEEDAAAAPGVAGEFAASDAAAPEPRAESPAVSPGAAAPSGAVVDATSVAGTSELDRPIYQCTPTQPSATATTTATIGPTNDFRSAAGSGSGSELNTARMTSRVEPSLVEGFATTAAAVAVA